MISHLEGILRKKNPDIPSVEVEIGGIWYEVQLPFFVWRAVESIPLGEMVGFEILYHVAERQPIPKLVGFTREIERDFFRKFIEVPDIGPSKALKAMTFSVSTIARWIENGNVASLTRLPGIGKRGAETMVAQLKGKVVEEALLVDEGFEELPPTAAAPSIDEARDFAIEGLVHLGYKRSEAERWVEEITRTQALERVEDIIRAVFAMRSQEL
jgi:Holliday junction DNA helicase RuvA